jgi:hypothetical protein
MNLCDAVENTLWYNLRYLRIILLFNFCRYIVIYKYILSIIHKWSSILIT